MTRTIRIGIIGSGGIARAHASAYKKLPLQVEIVAVADSLPGRAQAFIDQEELVHAIAFEDHRKLLELDLDGVSICTPNCWLSAKI
jgi:predicted dehydrogenase